jgi:hypothetical protein
MPTIPSYDPAAALDGTELFVVDQAGVTKKATSDQVKTYSQGYQGTPGNQGNQGNQGEAGSQGATGNTGLTGDQGETGATGGVMAWQGTWASTTTYAIDDAVEYNGSTYISLTNSNLNNTPDSSPVNWDLSASEGAQGDQGASVTGAQGDQGDQGASVTGAQGDQGDQGASVTGAQGDQGHQGESVTGSKGDQGDQGDQGASVTGAQGDQGDQGAAGSTFSALTDTDIGTQYTLTSSDIVQYIGSDWKNIPIDDADLVTKTSYADAGTVTRTIAMGSITSFYQKVNTTNATLTINLTSPSVPYRGLNDIRLSGKGFVTCSANITNVVVQLDGSSATNIDVVGDPPTNTNDWAVLAWEYFDDGTVKRLFAAWTGNW